MNSKLIKILLATCLVLVVILLAEWTYANYSNKELLSSMDNIEQQPYVDDKLPEIDLSMIPIEHYAEMIARPLFIQGRKPVVEDQNEVVEVLLDTGDIDDWVLVGIYSINKQFFASFKSREEKKHRSKQEGDDISGWKIKEILAEKVIVVRAGKQQIIQLRKPKAAVTPMTKARAKTKARSKLRPKLQPKPRRKPKRIQRTQTKITPEK